MNWSDKITINDSKIWVLIPFVIVGMIGSLSAYMLAESDSEYCPTISTPGYKTHCYERLESESFAVWALPVFSISIGIFMFILTSKIESKRQGVQK